MTVFGAAHIYWSLGGAALPPSVSPWGDTSTRITGELAAIGLCAAGAVVAVATVRPWGARVPRGALVGPLWLAACLAFVQSVSTVVDDLLAAGGLLDLNLRDGADRAVHLVYAPYVMLGAALCALAALAAMSRPVTSRPASSREDPADRVLGCSSGNSVLHS